MSECNKVYMFEWLLVHEQTLSERIQKCSGNFVCGRCGYLGNMYGQNPSPSDHYLLTDHMEFTGKSQSLSQKKKK